MQVLKEGVAPSLHRRSKQQTETGRVVNIMSADVNNIIQFFYPMMAQLVVAPCILIAALVLLWFQIRWVLPPLHCSQGSCFVCCCCLIAGFSYCIVCILRADAKPEPLRRLHSFLSEEARSCVRWRGVVWRPSRWATFIGLAMLVLCSPATGFFVKRLTGLRRRMLLETDSRVKLMNQLLTGIRVLKLYAWEAAQEAAVRTLVLLCSLRAALISMFISM